MSEEWQTSAGVEEDLALVLVFLGMNDAVRNGYSKIRCSPTRFPMGQEYCDRSHCGFFNWKLRGMVH